MLNKTALMQEIEDLPDEYLYEVFDFVGYLKKKAETTPSETMLLSESALAREWDTPEEDEAWADL